jgi:hypothetical protein
MREALITVAFLVKPNADQMRPLEPLAGAGGGDDHHH